MSATPPKKSDVEQPAQSPDEDETPMDREGQDAQGQSIGYEFEVKEQDRWLPIANVARIMKLALPENAKIAKEAKECMQECVSEFISFITSEASEKCQQEKRKTVNGEDILFAMTSLGFENYAEALKIYLTRYRETLLANQNKPNATFVNSSGAPGSGASASGAQSSGNASANFADGTQNAGNNNGTLLSGDMDDGNGDGPSAFGYNLNNGATGDGY